MFSSLSKILNSKSDTLTVTLSLADNLGVAPVGTQSSASPSDITTGIARYRVNLFLKSGHLDKSAKQVLEKPVSLLGTLAELDGPEFMAGILSLVNANQAVKDAFETAETERKSAAAAAPAKKNPSSRPASPSPKPASPAAASHRKPPLKQNQQALPSKYTPPQKSNRKPATPKTTSFSAPKRSEGGSIGGKKLSGAAYRKLKKQREAESAPRLGKPVSPASAPQSPGAGDSPSPEPPRTFVPPGMTEFAEAATGTPPPVIESPETQIIMCPKCTAAFEPKIHQSNITLWK